MEPTVLLSPSALYSASSYRQFEAGEKHIDRITREYVLLFLLKSTLYFSENGTGAAVREGEWYLQLPGIHQSGNRGCPAPFYYYIHFRMPDAAVGGDGLMRLPLRGTFHPSYFTPLFDEIERYNRGYPVNTLGRQAAFLRILEALTQSCRTEKTAEQQLLAGVMEYLSRHSAEHITRAELRERFHYSPDYISQVLRKEKGLGFKSILSLRRIEKAKNLLAYTDDAVTEIAHLVGYNDNSVFYKEFRKQTGLSPQFWRLKSRGLL